MKLIARLLVFWIGIFVGGAALAEKRIALVIGNSDYQAAPALPNPANDAAAIGEALTRLGFDVMLGLDQTGDSLRSLVHHFSLNAEGADLALFFYAGHGIQVAGQNYLIPVDASLDREADLDFSAVALPLVLKQMERSAKNSVILLDACRDNPFESRLSRSMGQTRSASALGRGLAPVETIGGALIGFATDPGEVAFDGEGQNSPFTEALLNHIETPGLEVNTLMTRVRADVVTTTQFRQRPWATSSLLDELYLAPLSQPEPEAKRQGDAVLDDVAAWRKAEETGTKAAYSAYLTRFPQGLFAAQAALKLEDAVKPGEDRLALRAPEARPEPESAQPAPALNCRDCPPVVFIAGGEFMMGSASGSPEERPVTQVTIAPVSMSRGEITIAEYQRFMQASGYQPPDGCYIWTAEGKMRFRTSANWSSPGYSVANNSPVSCVNWQDAKAYSDWLSKVSGKAVRLPSEAELEYVIRAGTTGEYPFGGGAEGVCQSINAADASSRFSWKNKVCEDGFPDLAVADHLAPNALGLTATSGNLWEWAADCWNSSHKGASLTGAARADGQCESRVLRGGSWDDPIENLRSSYRVAIPAGRRQANVGFRIVIED